MCPDTEGDPVTQPRTTQGIVIGRFQPPHLGHLEYLEAALALCDELVIGLANPDLRAVVPCGQDPKRARSESNPFTYFERHQLIRATLSGSGWDPRTYYIVPAPVDTPEHLVQYLPGPSHGHFLVTIYDTWGEEKSARLRGLGYPVTVLWRRDMSERLTTGAELRDLLRRGDPGWREFTHPATHAILEGLLDNSGVLHR